MADSTQPEDEQAQTDSPTLVVTATASESAQHRLREHALNEFQQDNGEIIIEVDITEHATDHAGIDTTDDAALADALNQLTFSKSIGHALEIVAVAPAFDGVPHELFFAPETTLEVSLTGVPADYERQK